MKVVPPTNQNDQHCKGFTNPVIGLERPIAKDHVKGHYETLKLRTHPLNVGSPQFSFELSYFSTGTPEEFLLFQKGLRKVLEGQNLLTGPDMFATTRRMLEGDSLATFNNAADGLETINRYKRSMNALKRHVFPKRALQMQKRWMRRFLRKPKEYTIREYVARVREINSWFPAYPVNDGDEVLPTRLDDDKLLDLLEFGTPNSWKKEMVKQGFAFTTKTIQEFVEFCERLEICEATNPTLTNNNRNDNNHPDKSQKGKRGTKSYKRKDQASEDGSQKYKKAKNSFWFMQHGENSTHNTNKCEYIKSQLKRLNGTYNAQHPSKKKEFKKKQELQMLIGDIADKAVKKVAKDNKKRRAKDDSSSEEEEYHNIEQLNNQLKKVTFQMEQDNKTSSDSSE
jgi:hypothetical protein